MNIWNFSQFLVEAKNVGIIYHFTSLYHLSQICVSDALQSQRETEDLKHIKGIPYYGDKRQSATHHYFSFTRNKLFNNQAGTMLDYPLTCCLCFDGTSLSHHHKLIPVNYFETGNKHDMRYYDGMGVENGRHVPKHTKYTSRDESEEALISTSDRISKISRYLIGVQLPSLAEYNTEFARCISSNNDSREGFIYDIKDVLVDIVEQREENDYYRAEYVDDEEDEEEPSYMEIEDVLAEMCNEESFTARHIEVVYNHFVKTVWQHYGKFVNSSL